MVTKRFRADTFELIDDHSGNHDGNLAQPDHSIRHQPVMVKERLTPLSMAQAASG
jgi:hypothetical protein